MICGRLGTELYYAENYPNTVLSSLVKYPGYDTILQLNLFMLPRNELYTQNQHSKFRHVMFTNISAYFIKCKNLEH